MIHGNIQTSEKIMYDLAELQQYLKFFGATISRTTYIE